MSVGKVKPWVGFGIFVAVSATLFVVTGGLTDLPRARSKYEENRAATLKLGLMQDIRDAEQVFSVPHEQNGAKAFFESVKQTHPHSAMSNQEAAMMQRVSKFPRLRLRSTQNLLSSELPNEFALYKSWCTSLRQRILNEIKANQAEETQKDLLTLARLSVLASDEGSMISLMIRCGLTQDCHFAMRDILESKGRNSAWLGIVKSTLDVLTQPIDVRRVVSFQHAEEVSWVNFALAHPQEFEAKYKEMPLSKEILDNLGKAKYLAGFGKANLSMIHKFYAQAYEAAPVAVSKVGELKKLAELSEAVRREKGLSYALVSDGAFDTLAKAIDVMLARQNVLARSHFYMSSIWNPINRLPDFLGNGKDADGKDIRVKQVDGKWIVYSVSYNLVDDGGNSEGKDFIVHLTK